MSGILFIVIVPTKDYEDILRNVNVSSLIIEKESLGKRSSSVQFKRFGSKIRGAYVPEDAGVVLSKCRSTECLSGEKEITLPKSKSENDLLDNVNLGTGLENVGYLKSSWEELKQIVKMRRNKLSISSKPVDIGAAFHPETPLETILSEVLQRLKITNAAWSFTRNNNFWQVTFSLESGNLCEETLQVLKTFGIGKRFQSSVCVIPCALYYQSNTEDASIVTEEGPEYLRGSKTAWSRFTSSVRARTNLAQVLNEVRADAVLTFDWVFLLIVAAFVAAIGLIENSTVILVASMLISPLMGPITAATLGTTVRDRSLQNLGVQNELMGLFLSLVIGFVFGLSICAVDERYGIGDWPTYEMLSRCEVRSLWVGVLVAIPSGAGVALAVLGEYTASLVGVAISASLLPPAVNAGLLWAMALVHLIFLDDATRWTGIVKTSLYSNNPATELAVLGTVSLCLTLVNIICIFLSGVAVYKIKEVSPLERRDIPWWRAKKNFLNHSNTKLLEKRAKNWNIYSAWCNQTKDPILESDKSSKTQDVQSDTVTFRRHRYQQPEEPLSQHLQLGTVPNSFNRFHEMKKQQAPEIIVTPEDSIETTARENSKFMLQNNYRATLEYFKDCNRNEQDCPIIEPSYSFTVNPKKSDIILSSKSFDV